MNVPPCCNPPPLGGSLVAGTNAHIPTHSTLRLKPVSLRMMTRAWSVYFHVHLPPCALPDWQTSTSGGTLLGPCRVLPQAQQKAKEETACQVFIPYFSLGARAPSKIALVLWVMVAMQGEQGRCGPQHCVEGAWIY